MKASNWVVSTGPAFLWATRFRKSTMEREKMVPVEKMAKMLVTEVKRSISPLMLFWA
jgi:hypothetical protein